MNSSPSNCFSSAAQTRDLLEDIVINGEFANVIPISQTNPRLLVGAAHFVLTLAVEESEADKVEPCVHKSDDMIT